MRGVTILSLAVLATTAVWLGAGIAGAAGPPAQAPLVDVSIGLTQTEATAGELVDVTATATVRSTGQNVPSAPGELRIEVCSTSLLDPVSSVNCDGGTATWELIRSARPAVASHAFDTTQWADHTIGFRARYVPKGSGFAGGVSQAVDLVVTAPAVSVSVSPAGVTLTPGGQQQFVAIVQNATDPAVTWSATGGSITQAGLYTAGSTPGTYQITATSVQDPSQSAIASVIIGAGVPGTFAGTCTDLANPGEPLPVSGVSVGSDATGLAMVIPFPFPEPFCGFTPFNCTIFLGFPDDSGGFDVMAPGPCNVGGVRLLGTVTAQTLDFRILILSFDGEWIPVTQYNLTKVP